MSRPPPLRFREFPPGEADQLLRLYKQCFWAGHRRRADTLRMLKHTSLTYSAWRGKRLVAFCRVLTDFTYRAMLFDVVVDDCERGSGVGRQLIRRLQNHPRLRRVEKWCLSTKDKHRFYEHLGWTRNSRGYMELHPS